MSGRRSIIVNGRTWRYRVGDSWCVAKADDNGEGKKINLSELTKMSWANIEDEAWNRTFHVTPKQISDWLSN